jgi:hypothetical protein
METVVSLCAAACLGGGGHACAHQSYGQSAPHGADAALPPMRLLYPMHPLHKEYRKARETAETEAIEVEDVGAEAIKTKGPVSSAGADKATGKARPPSPAEPSSGFSAQAHAQLLSAPGP